MSQPFPNHRYLTGSFAPILFEADAYDLPVRGEIPKELPGTLYRNSPNPQFAPRDNNYHWFLGDGMVHAFHIADAVCAIETAGSKHRSSCLNVQHTAPLRQLGQSEFRRSVSARQG